MKQTINYRIDNLQYCNWSREIFQINNEAKLDAVHVTIAYHEDFNEVKKNFEKWNNYFQENKNTLIPRPDTEILVEHAAKQIFQWQEKHPGEICKIVELGTGTAAIR